MASFKGISVDLSTSRDSPQPALLKDAVIGSKGVAVPGSAAYLLPDFSTLKPQELILTVALEPNGSHAPYLKPRREAPTFDDYFKLSPHFSHHAHWDECIKIKFKFFYSILSSPSSADDLTRRMLRSDELLVEERDDKIRSSYHFDLLGLLELGERLKDEKCLDSTTLDLVIMTGGKDGNDIVRAKFKLILKKRRESVDTKESMDRSDIARYYLQISPFKTSASSRPRGLYGRQGSPPRSSTSNLNPANPKLVTKAKGYDGYSIDTTGSNPTKRPARFGGDGDPEKLISGSRDGPSLSANLDKFYKERSNSDSSMRQLPGRQVESEVGRQTYKSREEVPRSYMRRNDSPDRRRGNSQGRYAVERNESRRHENESGIVRNDHGRETYRTDYEDRGAYSRDDQRTRELTRPPPIGIEIKGTSYRIEYPPQSSRSDYYSSRSSHPQREEYQTSSRYPSRGSPVRDYSPRDHPPPRYSSDLSSTQESSGYHHHHPPTSSSSYHYYYSSR